MASLLRQLSWYRSATRSVPLRPACGLPKTGRWARYCSAKVRFLPLPSVLCRVSALLPCGAQAHSTHAAWRRSPGTTPRPATGPCGVHRRAARDPARERTHDGHHRRDGHERSHPAGSPRRREYPRLDGLGRQRRCRHLAHGRPVAEAVPGAEFAEITAAGHHTHLEAPKATWAAIDPFLARI